LELTKYFATFPKVDVNTTDFGTPEQTTNAQGHAHINQTPALHQAAGHGLTDIVQFLLTLDSIDVNLRDLKGQTALHYAARWNQMEVIRLLLDVPGIDITAVEDRNVHSVFLFKHLSMWQSILKMSNLFHSFSRVQ
jgi:ankyrin repeat protein